MAEVFLAQQRGLEGFDRRVAVKRILPHLADSPDFVKMFLGEARLAAQLAHPNVVHIYEFGKVDHDYFIAMEFVDGVHAGQLFKHGQEKAQDKVPPTLVARIGADAANALHYAHELRGPTGQLLGLVHRDVSPANIMVSFDGVVKLCDFGIAKAAAAGDQLTNPGQVKGKYAYMSPEQTIASQLDGRSDVFSLAIVMWELLTGRYIVQRGDAVAAMRAIRDGKLDPIDKVAPEVPAPLATALTWALEPKRDKRATAAEFAQALEAFLKSAPDLATSMQLGGWIRARFVREGTGQLPALHTPPHAHAQSTHVSPGTFVAPGTAAASPGTVVGARTGAMLRPATPPPMELPPPGYPPRRVVKLMTDTAEGTEIYSTADLDDNAETIKGARPPRFPPVDRPSERPSAVGDETEVVRNVPVAADEEDSDLGGETIMRDRRAPISSGPAVMPTRMHHGAVPGAAAISDSSAHPPAGDAPGARRQATGEPRRRNTPLPVELGRKRRHKIVLAVAGLGGLTLLSFMIALAASNQDRRGTTPQDAEVALAVQADAALPIAPPPADAALEEPEVAPTIPVDAAVAEPGEPAKAYLVVRTIPEGGNVKVGNQSRASTVQPGDPTGAATAQLVLDAGKHTVVAELAGFQREKRVVVLENGEHQRIEITFTKKIVKREERGRPMGRLTVRTTPWSDVYLGNKKLGQAPFADLQLPAGTHTLTFKNPSRPTVTKTVTIKPGKSAKLNFSLP